MTEIEARRDAIAALWDLDAEIVLIAAGDSQPIPGTDQFHGFRAHPEHRYLTDSEHPGDVLAFDPKAGWTHFMPQLSADDLVWYGGHQRAGTPLDELDAWLDARRGRPLAELGCARNGVDADEELTARLRTALEGARRVKDGVEQALLRAAADATRFGFLAAMKEARPGLTERQIQIELEAGFFRAGATRTAFDSVVASGPNAAVLHFSPTARPMDAGDLVLIDAGAEVGGYACDCTRTFVVGRPSPEQTDLHQLVREVQEAAVAKCVPGKEYKDIHLEATARFAQGLKDFGLLKGKVDALLERDAVALFFPHGIGHLIGLAIHDTGGFAAGRTGSDAPGLRWLRADLPLEAGIAITIEPGLYFIPALLENPETRDSYRDIVDWLRVDALLRFGGIRVEDTVLVTDGEPEVLTKDIPKGIVV